MLSVPVKVCNVHRMDQLLVFKLKLILQLHKTERILQTDFMELYDD